MPYSSQLPKGKVVRQVEQQADAATTLGTVELNTLETGFVFQAQDDLYAEGEEAEGVPREEFVPCGKILLACPAGR